MYPCGFTSAKGTGNLHIINEIMDKLVYLNILKNHLTVGAKKFGILENFNVYQDNDPKHKSHLVQQWLIFNISRIIAIHPHPQSPDLNPIKHLWEDLVRKIRKRSISNRGELKRMLQSE